MLNKITHREIMYKILRDIYSSDVWKNLAFKWWTACYFFHQLDRFSTDLDFDLLDLSIDDIDSQLIPILKRYGDVKVGNYNIALSYELESVNIKIDVSRNVRENNIYKTSNLYWVDIKQQEPSTIFANKLVALTQRNTNRDIYDVYFFLDKWWAINEKVIFERTGQSVIELFEIILAKLKNLPKNYKILDWLWEVLDEKQKIYVKNELVKNLINTIQFKVDFSDK